MPLLSGQHYGVLARPRGPAVPGGRKGTELAARQAAAWLQRLVNRDEAAFRRRTEAVDALRRLRVASEALVYRVNAEQATVLALEHESQPRGDVNVSTQLVIEGHRNRLVWTVAIKGLRNPALSRALDVDAHNRMVLARADLREHGVTAFPVKHYSHPGGIKDAREA